MLRVVKQKIVYKAMHILSPRVRYTKEVNVNSQKYYKRNFLKMLLMFLSGTHTDELRAQIQ